MTEEAMTETAWVKATPEQLARSNELGQKWREEAADPIVAVGAATGVLMNVINQDVPAEHQEQCVEAVYASLCQLISNGETTMAKEGYFTIALSHRAPVRIMDRDWPMAATGHACDWRGQRDDPTCGWSASITVRQHSDGRFIAYGRADYVTRYANEQDVTIRVGELHDAGYDLVTAIDEVKGDLLSRADEDGDGMLIRQIEMAYDECLSDLPAEDLT